jgi:heptosyltransferase II
LNILIRATNWIGDAVMSLPVLRAVREKFPCARISVLARPWVAALYENESSVDAIISLDGAPGPRDWRAKWKTAKTLRAQHFDLALLLTNSFESAALVRLAGTGRVIGYARDGRSWLLTEPIPVPKKGDIPEHERFYYLELLRRSGLIDSIPDVPFIRLGGIEEARMRGEALFESSGLTGPVVGVSPGAAYGSAKRWLPQRFAESAARVASSVGGSVAVFGSKAEISLCEQVADLAGARNFAGATTLRQFIDMTAACRVFFTNDSGAMHIASALEVPSITVFGPTNEHATGPLGASARVLRVPVSCAPCMLRECPIDHRCMTGVGSDLAVQSAEQLMKPPLQRI